MSAFSEATSLLTLETVQTRRLADIALVSIHSPPVNAITPQLLDDLDAAFLDLGARSGLRCVILASALEKAFVAGADIKQFTTWTRESGTAALQRGHAVLLSIARFPAPVICAINGIAFGGGLELALACDMRVIAENARVGLPEVGLGIIPGYGGTQRLPRLVGAGMAKKLILSGAAIDAEEACRIGLAESLSPAGEVLEAALALAEQIAAQAPLSVAAAKRCVDFAMEHPFSEGMDYEIAALGALIESEDKREGVQAFLEKRKPIFHNR